MSDKKQSSDQSWSQAGMRDGRGEHAVERAVLAQLLRHDRPLQQRAHDLPAQLPGVAPTAVRRALRHLAEAGVIYRSGPFVWRSSVTDHLLRLGAVTLGGPPPAPE